MIHHLADLQSFVAVPASTHFVYITLQEYSKMASGGLKQCCATGSLHTGTPTGRIDKVHGLDCYIADAPSGSPKGIVVIIPDAFGWTLPNNRILADA